MADRRFIPSDKTPGYGLQGNTTPLSEKGDMGKFLPCGDKYGTEGVSTPVKAKGALGKFLPEGKRFGVDGV